MIEFLKKLPLGISVPYLMFKFSDNIKEYLLHKKEDAFSFKIQDEIDIVVYKNEYLPDSINISFCEKSRNIAIPSNISCIPIKESTNISPTLLETLSFTLVVNDRKIIDTFYENVEEEFKNGDCTKLILAIGKDPFKYCDVFLNDRVSGELFKSLSKDFIRTILNEKIL